MAKTKKKKSNKRKSNSKSSGGGLLISIIAIVIIGAVAYGMFFQKDTNQLPDFMNPSKYKSSKGITASEIEIENNSKQGEKQVKKSDELVDPAEITSLDGKVEKTETNKALPDYENENPYYFTSSFDFVWPAYSNNDQVIEHTFFTLCYNEKMEQADWVAYKLTAKNLSNAKYKRRDNFREDPLVQTKSAHPSDYKGSGYDRGHLAPAADFTWTKEGLDESFYMSNMSPQLPGFNRGVWKKLEEKTRDFAKSNGEVLIVTGPVFKGKNQKIGKNKVAVPDQYYKVIIELQGEDVKGIGFVLSHEKSSADLSNFALSIDEIEKLTGLDFFPSIPDELERKIECCARYSAW